jgi:hypothetical protein
MTEKGTRRSWATDGAATPPLMKVVIKNEVKRVAISPKRRMALRG